MHDRGVVYRNLKGIPIVEDPFKVFDVEQDQTCDVMFNLSYSMWNKTIIDPSPGDYSFLCILMKNNIDRFKQNIVSITPR